MTNQFHVVEGRSVTAWQAAGPALSLIVAVIAVVMLVLFFAGLVSWFRRGRPWVFGWWLRNLSIWTALLGAFAHAMYWVRNYGIRGGAMIKPELWNDWHHEAYTRLALPVLVALIGWGLGMILGPERKRNAPTTT